MRVYFACSISGGRKDEKTYQHLVKMLQDQGAEVLTAHIAETGIEVIDGQVDPLEIYQRDVSWIEESDLLIAEVSTPSHGVGYEIGYALSLGKPVLCLYDHQAVVSKMITGNPHTLLTLRAYSGLEDLSKALESYLTGFRDDLGVLD